MRLRLAFATVLAVLVPAGAAQAVTTVGPDLTAKTASASVCAPASQCTYFTGDPTTAAPAAVVPFDGVVVRWRVKSGSPSALVRLRMLRPATGGRYLTAGASDQQTATTGTSTFASRIPVKAGDVVGLDDSSGTKLFAPTASLAAYVFQPFLGASALMPTSHTTSRELLVNADVEHDADGDGYGDETQDLCPTDPSRHTACIADLSVNVRPAPAPLTVGRPLTFTVKVANAGPSTASDVALALSLPFTATPLQVRAGHGTCAGGYTVTCNLGAIAANDSTTVVLTVRPEVPGTLVMTAAASTSTQEVSTDDDGFTSDVTVLPPTLRLLDLRLSQSSIRVGGRLAIKWYETDTAVVTLSLARITHKGRHLPAGSFRVIGTPGSNAVLFKGRIPKRKRLKPGTYEFTVAAATLDGRVAAPGHLRFQVRRTHGS